LVERVGPQVSLCTSGQNSGISNNAVAGRFHGIGSQRDVDGGDDGNGGGDKPSRRKRPALQPRPDMDVRAAKRMRNNKEEMQESSGVLGV